MDSILDEKLKKELGGNVKDIIYDRETAKEETPKQKLNAHQRKQLRKKNLLVEKGSSTKEKAKKRKEQQKERNEKYNRRNEVIAKMSQVKLSEADSLLIKPSSELGVKSTKRQLLEDAILKRDQGLPYDAKIIEESERKKAAAEAARVELQRSLEEIVEKEPPKLMKDIAPVPVIKPIKAKPAPIIEVKEEAKPAFTIKYGPAINVQVHRTEEIEKIRSKLPIIGEEQVIMENIMENDVVVICGETGSGKTTQLPQFLFEAGYGTQRTKGKIAITEPRRVAAINMAKRVSTEMGFTFGQQVGYQIRNDRLFTPQTVIKFLTDGVLLREMGDDLALKDYSVIVIDEAHERTINTDLLIGFLSRIVALRRKKVEEGDESYEPLKLIIMSATLRVDDFIKNPRLFEIPPPKIDINVRQFPVNEHFSANTPDYIDLMPVVKHTVEQIHETMPAGGILVFLPGKKDIIECVNYFKNLYKHAKASDALTNLPKLEQPEEIENIDAIMNVQPVPVPKTRQSIHVLPLYSLLEQKEQQKVFQDPPPGHRLIVFATNVAETSITIPNIRYVVDSGYEKSRTYDFSKGIIATKVTVISRASAEQRKGRAGRTGPGHCFRLYSSAVYGNILPEYSTPEIQRRPVDEVVLLLKTRGMLDISIFPFPSLIPEISLKQAEETLQHLGALEMEPPHRVTSIGKLMSLYPLSPRIARLLVFAQSVGVLDYGIIVSAALSVREPFSGVPDSSIRSDKGDIIRLLCAFGAYTHSNDKFKDCKDWNIRIDAMEEIQSIRLQLIGIMEKLDQKGLNKSTKIDPPDNVELSKLTTCIFAAFCDHVAKREGKTSTYITADGKKAYIHGNSSVYNDKPLYVTYVDIEEVDESTPKLLTCMKIGSQLIAHGGSQLYLHRSKVGPAEYNPQEDQVQGKVSSTFGTQNWALPDVCISHPEPYKCFAAALIDGRVVQSLKQFSSDITSRTEDLIKNRQLPPRLLMIVSALKKEAISTRASLEAKWETEPTFLLTEYLYWITSKSTQSKIQKGWPFISKVAQPIMSTSSSSDDE